MFYTLPMFKVNHAMLAVAVVALSVGVTVVARAQASPSARQLLDGYVAEALAANLTIARQSAALTRADAGVREANGRFLPSVGLNARYSEFSGVVNIGDFINPAYAALNQLIGQSRFPTDVNATLPFRQETKLELTQPLFNDALFGARAAARAQRDLVGATRKAAMRQLSADIQQAWLGYASTVRAVETLESTLPLLDENVRVSERLIGAGQATPDVLLRARAERSELLQQIQEATRQRHSARRGFNLLRNRDDESPIALADDSTLVLVDSLSRAALLSSALRHREELAQAGSGITLARAQQRIAAAAYLPNLALAASYGVQGDRYRFDNRSDVGLASLVLSWNAFNGGQDAARRAQANATRTEAVYRRREAERAITLQVGNAFDAVQSARSTLVTADDRLASAQRAFSLVQRRFAEGLATPVEFLSARTAFTSAAINQVITRFSFATRVVELERAAALRALPN
ncbi:TolC family protein [Gemmatimonas sp.]|uniref:TolC family protein n=1 Tax=Gemmatimonas sp. TaxID=1962908 RepID=UPI00398361E3